MLHARKVFKHHLILSILLLLSTQGFSQCPQVYDFFGNVADNPYWYNCSGFDYNFNLQSPDDWDSIEIDWGDGSAIETQTPWNSPDIINHTYVATVDTFIVTLTEPSSGCVVQGVVVMEEATSASIQIPVGGLTQACAPQLMEFINSATNTSETTIFTWDFGDGSPQLVFDYTNLGQTVSHVYEPQTVDCETEVSLTAENYCNTIQGGPSEATFNPIRIWDVDDAAITASATVLCYPDTVVTLENTTERNCLFQGNIFQRYDYWNFGDYWGAGQDSIVDWTPWPPTTPHTLAYPGIGTYEVMMLDSNYCGIDTATIVIEIVPPPTAGLTVSADSVCVGDPITFFQGASGGGNQYSWNFGDGIGWLPTGGGNITYVYNSPGIYEVCTAVNISGATGSCSDTACVDVTVLPGPIADINFDGLVGCDSLWVDLSDNSTGAEEYAWTFDIAPFTDDTDDPPPIFYPAPGNYVVNLTVTSENGCVDNDQEIVVVFEAPTPDIIANNVCQGEEASFLDISTFDAGDPILSWIWDFGDGSPTSNLQHPTHTFDSTGSFNVTLTVNTGNCSSTETFPIEVEPAPVPSFTLTPVDGCSPLWVQFTNTSVGADTYFWEFGDGNGSIMEHPSHVFEHYGVADTTFTIYLTAQTTFGCNATDSATVNVQPGAIAAFDDNSVPPSCSPFSANFINNSIGASSYLWDFGDGATSIEENPDHFYNNDTGFIQFFDVSLIAYADNGCNDTTGSTITVYPLADWDLQLVPDSGCSPLIVTMPFVPGVIGHEWDFGDGATSTLPNPTHIYENTTLDAQFFTVQLIGVSAFGCLDTAYAEVQVNPQPVANFTVDVTQGCSPLDVTFTNNSLQATDYMWVYAPGDTTYVSDPTHTHTLVNLGPGIQVYEIELWALSADGCFDTYSFPIQVYPEVIASFENPGPACSPLAAAFENTSLNADTYQWDLGNGTTSGLFEPSVVYVNSSAIDSAYVVCMTAESIYGCTASTCEDVVILPTPNAGFTMDNNTACDPAPVTFTNLSTGATDYFWDYGNGDTSTTSDLEHSYTYDGESIVPVEFTITLTATSSVSGCSNEYSTIFTVLPQVIAAAAMSGGGCAPAIAEFQNLSIGDNAGVEWDFGDGSTSIGENPIHPYLYDGDQDTTYTVTLVAHSTFGCTDTAFVEVEIWPTPTADFEIDSTVGCYPLEVFFSNNSSGDGEYQWVYGTGEVGSTPEPIHSHTFFNFGETTVTYNVTLNMTSEHGCTSSDQLPIEVYPALHADFEEPDPGCSPHLVTFENTSQGGQTFLWDFGNGEISTLTSPIMTFETANIEDTTFTVQLIAESYFGCYDTIYQDVTVYATPQASFEATPFSQIFPETTIDLTDNSIAGDATEYFWNMGDGAFLQDNELASYTYETWGTYDIELTLSNGACQDDVLRTIEIIAPMPVAFFDVNMEGCAPLTVEFENLSGPVSLSLWDFGDGGMSTNTSPVYTYYTPGVYDVTLTVQGFSPGQEDVYTIQQAVTVHAPAVAAFTYTPDQVNVPGEPIYTVNLSQNATEYYWDFGDGSNSDEHSPTHLYQEAGVYTITLIANNEVGCPDTLILPAAVHAIEYGYLEFPNAFTPNLIGANDGIYDPQAYDNNIFHPIHAGVETYTFQIFNKWGELLFETDNVYQGWNGYYRDTLSKEDVYVWKAKARFTNGTETVQSGDVTLLIR